MKKLLDRAGLAIVLEAGQQVWPKELAPCRMFCCEQQQGGTS